MNIYEIITVKLSPFIAGGLGGSVAMMSDPNMSRRKAFFLVTTGAITAGYLTPIVVHYFNTVEEINGAISFLIGLLAMRLTSGFLKIGDKFSYNPIEFIKYILAFRGKLK